MCLDFLIDLMDLILFNDLYYVSLKFCNTNLQNTVKQFYLWLSHHSHFVTEYFVFITLKIDK